jgi:hypothetical protein
MMSFHSSLLHTLSPHACSCLRTCSHTPFPIAVLWRQASGWSKLICEDWTVHKGNNTLGFDIALALCFFDFITYSPKYSFLLDASNIVFSCSKPLVVELHVVGREKSRLSFVRTEPPILIGELQIRNLCVFGETELIVFRGLVIVQGCSGLASA